MVEVPCLDFCTMVQEGNVAKASFEEDDLTIEQLRHSLPVLSLQWSHGDLHSGERLPWHPHVASIQEYEFQRYSCKHGGDCTK